MASPKLAVARSSLTHADPAVKAAVDTYFCSSNSFDKDGSLAEPLHLNAIHCWRITSWKDRVTEHRVRNTRISTHENTNKRFPQVEISTFEPEADFYLLGPASKGE